jgi:hypothetical protein
MERLGTIYGGWILPKDIELNDDSVVYSAGVGEDISFDILLSDKYKCNIILIDPTKRAKKHYDEVVHFYEKIKWKMSGDIQEDYYGIMYPLKPDLTKITYMDKGLWDKQTTLKFYKQRNEQYVSQTLIEGMFGNDYDEVDVNTLKNIMEKNNHKNIDILKLDIEGAEINVLENMIDEKIFPKYICVEFDLYLKGKDKDNKTQTIIDKLKSVNYEIIANEKGNITFKLN